MTRVGTTRETRHSRSITTQPTRLSPTDHDASDTFHHTQLPSEFGTLWCASWSGSDSLTAAVNHVYRVIR